MPIDLPDEKPIVKNKPEPEQPVLRARTDFAFNAPSTRFRIRGSRFSSGGVIRISGYQVYTTAWGGEIIEGEIPASIPSGEVIVNIDDATSQRGFFIRPPSETAVSTVLEILVK